MISAAVLLYFAWTAKPDPVSSFMRVGGPTRVETALNAAESWTSPPYVVTVPFSASGSTVLEAARCAAGLDAPLLFRGKPGSARDHRVAAALHGLKAKTIDFSSEACPQIKPPPSGLTILDVRHLDQPDGDELRRLDWVTSARRLASFVVVAAPRFRSNTNSSAWPDAAIGLALGAHLARHTPVTLIVMSRDSEADSGDEMRLRREQGSVRDGIVLGETKILSDQTRNVLRQTFATPASHDLASAWDTTIGRIAAVVLGVLALLGISGAAAAAATTIVLFFDRHHDGTGPPVQPGGTLAGVSAGGVASMRRSTLHVATRILEDMTNTRPGRDELSEAIATARTKPLARSWNLRDWRDLDDLVTGALLTGDGELYDALDKTRRAAKHARTAHLVKSPPSGGLVAQDLLDALKETVDIARQERVDVAQS